MHMTANNSSAKRKYDNSMPITDEGWWNSVLAEERLHSPARPQPVMKPKPPPEAKAEQVQEPVSIQANWDEVKELYSNDRIITMKVTGHNRGGLLVESDSFSGFVPFSHLIDLAGKDQETDREV